MKPLRAGIAAATVGFDVGLLGGWVNAFLGEADHAITGLLVVSALLRLVFASGTYVFYLCMCRHGFEFKEDNVHYRHLDDGDT